MVGAQEKESHSVCPQLCCLHADMLSSLGPKEAKKAFLDFYHSFLEKTAVRHLPAAPSLSQCPTVEVPANLGPPRALPQTLPTKAS